MNKEKEQAIQSFEFLRKINHIVATMRESKEGIIATTKEENRGKGIPLLRVEFPDTGGTLTYYEGIPYPTQGFVYGDTVEKVDEMKKMAMTLIKNSVKISIFEKIKLAIVAVLFRKTFLRIIDGLIDSFHHWIRKYKLKPFRYCTTCRELYRTLSLAAKDTKNPLIEKIRDIACMTLEYDDAYRYRFQDIISRMDKVAVEKNLIKELRRLFKMLGKKDPQLAGKWKMINIIMTAFLIINRKSKKILKDILLTLDLEELKLTEGDLYHAQRKDSYEWPETIQDKKEEQKKAEK